MVAKYDSASHSTKKQNLKIPIENSCIYIYIIYKVKDMKKLDVVKIGSEKVNTDKTYIMSSHRLQTLVIPTQILSKKK